MTPDKSDTPKCVALASRQDGDTQLDDYDATCEWRGLAFRIERENTRLTTQLAEAQKDAERYRWLRDKTHLAKAGDPVACIRVGMHMQMIGDDELDAAIDRAGAGEAG